MPVRPATKSALGRAGATSRPAALRRSASHKGKIAVVEKARDKHKNLHRESVVLRDVIGQLGSDVGELTGAGMGQHVDVDTGLDHEGERRHGLMEMTVGDRQRLQEGLQASHIPRHSHVSATPCHVTDPLPLPRWPPGLRGRRRGPLQRPTREQRGGVQRHVRRAGRRRRQRRREGWEGCEGRQPCSGVAAPGRSRRAVHHAQDWQVVTPNGHHPHPACRACTLHFA